MRTASILLFNHVDDAWEDGLRGWLEEGSKAALTGRKIWMVCRSFVQANWLRRRFVESGGMLMGIRFLDLRRLRHELCLRAGLKVPAFGRETLSLFLQAEANETSVSSAFAGQVLEALDELVESGWRDRYGDEAVLGLLQLPQSLRQPVRKILDSLLWRPNVDRILREKALSVPGLCIGFFGLDANALAQQDLLAAAAGAADEAHFWVAQPFVSESVFSAWIERLEAHLQAAVTVAASEGITRPYDELVSQFVYPGQTPVNLPRIVRTERWADQARAVVALVKDEFARGARNIAVALPESSPSGPAVIAALISAGLDVSDEFRSNEPLDHSSQVHRWLADWAAGQQTPEKLLEFFYLLGRGPNSYGRFREYLLKRFDERQTRSLRGLFPADAPYRWAIALLDFAPVWPAAAPWRELDAKWRETLGAFQAFVGDHQPFLRPIRVSLEPLQPNWDEIREFFGDRSVSSALFLRFISESLSETGRTAYPGASHRYAPIVVSTLERLHATSWDALILPDGVADLWTRLATIDSLLGQEFRRSAREAGLLLLTRHDEALLREDTILQLLLHARRSANICFYTREESGDPVDANRFVTFLTRSLDGPVQVFEPAEMSVAGSFPELTIVRRSRLDPTIGFDQYLFNFRDLDLMPSTWPGSALETVIAAPGTFALRTLFGSERSWDKRFLRDENRALGNLVHRLIYEVLKNPLGELFRNDLSELRQNRTLAACVGPNAYRVMAKLVLNLNPPTDDLWWASLVAKAIYLTECMLGEVTELQKKFAYGVTELSTGEIDIRVPELRLKGRFDLLLSDADRIAGANTAIVDFKTTNTLQRYDADSGQGFQLVAYGLMVKELGAASCAQIVAHSSRAKELSTNKVQEAIEAKLEELSWMQKKNCFGHASLLREEYGIREKLPLATLPIPAWVLEKKRVVTLNNRERAGTP
jgi:PD-(D/E)XK nuclease superfamily